MSPQARDHTVNRPSGGAAAQEELPAHQGRTRKQIQQPICTFQEEASLTATTPARPRAVFWGTADSSGAPTDLAARLAAQKDLPASRGQPPMQAPPEPAVPPGNSPLLHSRSADLPLSPTWPSRGVRSPPRRLLHRLPKRDPTTPEPSG
ncbi:hypothetical protein NDU88_001903 [Pleurodeles waltl]|uniref:Uncharacterized protein n=1 Tax=Pleurodeles waltl TaxID=8319 RepID=A0AAV7LZX3_PLEWA|nr:hypothetical protein NDU88_001903 [Pleurodeles waltl]